MFKKIINTFGTKFLSGILNFLIAAIISQAVGDVGKGEQSLLLTAITFILIFSDIVSGSSLVYLAPKHNFSKLILPAYLWSVLVGLCAAVTVPLFEHDLSAAIVLHVCALSALASISSVNANILIGRERVPAANYVNLWQPVALLGTLCLCYFHFHILNINAYIIALYVAYGGSWLGGLFLLRKEFRGFHFQPFNEYRDVLKDLFKYGFLNQTSHFVQFFNLRLSYYLLAAYIDKGSTGVFSNAVSLAEAIWIISRSIALVQYARIANAQDEQYSQKLTLHLGKACFLISAAAVLLLACIPSSFYIWFFGPEFAEIPYLIWILAPGTLFYSFYLIFGHYFSGSGRYQMNTYGAMFGMLFTFALGFTLVPRLGIYGAAITTTCANAANAAFMITFFLRRTHFSLRECLISAKDIRCYSQLAKEYLQRNFTSKPSKEIEK